MILPGTEKLEGIIGTTFDFVVTLYPSIYSSLEWSKNKSEWDSTTIYKVNRVVIGSNGSAYKCIIENTNVNPIGEAGHWEILTPLNLTGYKAFAKLGEILELKVGEGITLGGEKGTVAVKATKVQTAKFSEGFNNLSLFLEDTENNYYEYIAGPIKWKRQRWETTNA
jgi:hypothetical protein